MGGIIGRLFREFAVTLSTAIVASARDLADADRDDVRPHPAPACAHEDESRARAARPRRPSTGWSRVYDRGLGWVLEHQALTLLLTIATVALHRVAGGGGPQGAVPAAGHRAAAGRSPRRRADISFPAHVRSASRPPPTSSASDPDVLTRGLVHRRRRHQPHPQQRAPVDHAEAARPAQRQRAGDHRPAAAGSWPASPGVTTYLQAVQDLQIDTRISRTQYQYTLEDADPAELAAWAPQVLERLRQLPQLADVASDQQNGALQVTLVIDRDTASRLGITAQAIDDTLYDAFGQRPGLDHLHAAEPVPRDPGGGAAVPAEPGRRWRRSTCCARPPARRCR